MALDPGTTGIIAILVGTAEASMVMTIMAAGIMCAAGIVMTGGGVSFAETGIMIDGVATGTTTDGVKIGGVTTMAGAAGKATTTAVGIVTASSMAAMGTETDVEQQSNITKRLASKIASRFFIAYRF